LRVSYVAVVTDKLDSLTVTGVSLYSQGKSAVSKGIPASAGTVPIIHKDELDYAASAFLSKYCAEALTKPTPV